MAPEVDFDEVKWWFYTHDNEWQNDMEEAFYASDNTEGARSYIDWAYMQFYPDVEIEY